MADKMDYVASKKAHMKMMGIEVGRGLYGGACPKWLEDQRDEEEKRVTQRFNKNNDIVEDDYAEL